MNRNQIFSCVLILWVGCNSLLSQRDRIVDEDITSISFARQVVFNSKILGEKRTINIYVPESFHKTPNTHTYPVLLLLEDKFFHMVCGVIEHLSLVERMPETIIVSLVDGPDVPKLFTNQSDFWPKDWKQIPFGKNPKSFSKHLKEELFPYLKQKFRTNDFRMILGFSGSSMYTLHTLVKEPDLFDAHIAIASGDILGMGYTEGERFIDLITKNLEHDSSRKRYLYITSADSDAIPNSPMIKANIEELESRLSKKQSANFKFISRLFPNEGHYDVALPALAEAMELIFPKKNWSADYRRLIKEPGSAIDNIDSYFKKLSINYGFEILPKAERWNSGNSLSRVGPILLKQGKTIEAIEILERWVMYSPNSIEALCELSKAYEANNELEKSISMLEKVQLMSSKLSMKESLDYEVSIKRLRGNLEKQRSKRGINLNIKQ